mgnify:CR=1 FL=1
MTIAKVFIHLPKINVGYQTLINWFLSFHPKLDKNISYLQDDLVAICENLFINPIQFT